MYLMSSDYYFLILISKVLKPTIFASVPRVLNTLHEKTIALGNSSGTLKSLAFQLAYQAKTDGLLEGKLHDSQVIRLDVSFI